MLVIRLPILWLGLLALSALGLGPSASELGSLRAAELTAQEVTKLMNQLKRVGPQGKFNSQAQKAWSQLAEADPQQLPTLLAGIDQANQLAANWLRAAVDTIAERAIKEGKTLPIAGLEEFLQDTDHDPRARRLAYEWLAKVDKTAPGRIIPKMLNDPSVEMRREAVTRLQDQAAALIQGDNKADAAEVLKRALIAARDVDQVQDLAEKLRSLGEEVDLARHFGFVMDWHLIAPFDNTDEKGFDVAYPPEAEIKLDAQYQGKDGQTISWKAHTTADEFGIVNIRKALDHHKGSVAYCYTEFTSDKAQEVQLRLGAITAWKLWLNGQMLFEREEYHRGIRMDQYQMVGKLKKGKNRILLKVLQNEQTQHWAQRWQFQLRICDPSGTAILSTTRPASLPPQSAAD